MTREERAAIRLWASEGHSPEAAIKGGYHRLMACLKALDEAEDEQVKLLSEIDHLNECVLRLELELESGKAANGG